MSAYRQGLFAGPACGAAVGMFDCVRAAVDGGTVLGPGDWFGTVAVHAAVWLPLGLLAALVAGRLFNRKARATVLITFLGTAFFAAGAWANVELLPSFTSPVSIAYDLVLLGATVVLFYLAYLLPVPVPEPRPLTWLALLAAMLAAALAAPVVLPEEADDQVAVEVAGGERPNVLVFLVDTLRADHLGAYGYQRPTSPRFDAFAKEAALHLSCRAASTWTKPSTASILTGLLPAAHGAVEHRRVLPHEAVTLAEVFRSAGYRTAAFSDNPFISPEFGFGQGFTVFDYTAPSPFVNGTLLGKVLWTLKLVSVAGEPGASRMPRVRGSPELTARLLRWIDGLPEGEPWFGYVHAMEPHTPYDPPAPYRDTFAKPGFEPDLTEPPDWQGFLPFDPADPVPDEVRAHLVARYDEEILAWDAAFGALLDALEERGLADRTIVAVLSDHGEEFHEHGGWTHGHSLFEELLHVPLAIRVPGEPGRRVEAETRTMDLPATLAGLAGLTADLPGVGSSALPTVSEVRFGGAAARSIVWGGRKLIQARSGRQEATFAFDLKADPGEQAPLESPAWREKLDHELTTILRAAAASALRAGDRALTPEEEERLRGLGYLK